MQTETRLFPSTIVLALVIPTVMACAQKPSEVTYSPPAADIRHQFGMVAVVPGGCKTAYGVPTPAQGSGAGASVGAGQGALHGMKPGAALCAGGLSCILGAPAMVAGGLLGALAGSVVGSAMAHPVEAVVGAETALRQTMISTPADEMLVDLIVAKAGGVGFSARVQRSDNNFMPRIADKMDSDTTLLINVPIFALFGEGEIEPDANLIIGVEAVVMKSGAAKTVWSRSWLYRSASRPFFALARDEGKRLREEISAGLALIATKVVADVFVTTSPESYANLSRFEDLPVGVVRPVISCDQMGPYQ